MKPLLLLMLLLPMASYGDILPKEINDGQELAVCIKQNTQDCVKAACSSSVPADCNQQCKEGAETKCKALSQQL